LQFDQVGRICEKDIGEGCHSSMLNESFLGQREITNNTGNRVPEIIVQKYFFLGHHLVLMTKFEQKLMGLLQCAIANFGIQI
jgi:hypothetical protein